MNNVANSAFQNFLTEVETAERIYPNAIAAIASRFAAEEEAQEALDDQIADLKDHVCVRAANGVADGQADDTIELVASQFTDSISNGTIERRVAAMLTCVLPHQIGA